MTTPNTPRTPAEQSGDSGSLDGAETVSLTDLKRLRAAMTQGELEAVDEFIYDASYAIVEALRSDADAAGIVATHNAADVLIEIAEAALAYEQAVVTFRDSADRDDRPVFEGHRHRMNLAHDVLLSALAKVQP